MILYQEIVKNLHRKYISVSMKCGICKSTYYQSHKHCSKCYICQVNFNNDVYPQLSLIGHLINVHDDVNTTIKLNICEALLLTANLNVSEQSITMY